MYAFVSGDRGEPDPLEADSCWLNWGVVVEGEDSDEGCMDDASSSEGWEMERWMKDFVCMDSSGASSVMSSSGACDSSIRWRKGLVLTDLDLREMFGHGAVWIWVSGVEVTLSAVASASCSKWSLGAPILSFVCKPDVFAIALDWGIGLREACVNVVANIVLLG